MNKKILLAFLVLVAVIASIGAVSAFYEFNMPDGYKVDDSKNITNETTEIMGVKTIYNRVVMVNGDKNITVNFYMPEQVIQLSPSGGSEMKTINGIEGLYQKVDGRSIFMFPDKDGQFVQIDAPNDNLIKETMGK